MFGTRQRRAAERRAEGRRAGELEHLPAQPVDPLDRVGALRREDLRLDLLDVLEDAVDDRLVGVDDPVDDRGARRPGPARGAPAALEVLAHVAEPPASPCRTVIRKSGPTKTITSPTSTSCSEPR